MKAFQKIREKLEPTLEETQKKVPRSALTTHFSCGMGPGDRGWGTKSGSPESEGSGGGAASACRAVQNPLKQPKIVQER